MLAESAPQQDNLGELAQYVMDCKQEEASLNQKVKEIKEARKDAERTLVNLMEEQGIQRTGINGVNISLQNKRYPQVKDWDAFYKFVEENNAAYLFQRRVGAAAVNEYVETSGEDIPGVEFYEETELSARRA